jgi:WD40 repeat protein
LREPKEVASFKVPNEFRYLDLARFSPDGKTLVTTSTYGPARDLKMVDLPSGKEKKTKAGEGFAGSFAFAPDGRLYVAFGGKNEHQVQVWDLGKDQIVNRFKVPSKVTGINLSPDGKVLACTHLSDDPDARQLSIFDVSSGQVKAVLDSSVTSAFSPNSRVLAYAAADGAIGVYDVASDKERPVLVGHKSDVRSLTFVDNRVLVSNTGPKVLVGDKEDKTVRVWDAETGKQTALVECPQEPEHIAVFPDGKTLVTTHKDKTARFWSVETGKGAGVITPMENESVWHLAFTPDGKALITTHYDKGLIFWELPSRKKALTMKPLDVYCLKPVFTRDGKLMALPYTDGTVKLYELR